MRNLYLYRIQPVRPGMLLASTPEEDDAIARHFAYLEALTEQGVVLMAGRTLTTDQGSFGIAVFRADDDEAARSFVLADPAVAERVMRAEWYPFRVALLADDWGL